MSENADDSIKSEVRPQEDQGPFEEVDLSGNEIDEEQKREEEKAKEKE
jgi:hypothetical protein